MSGYREGMPTLAYAKLLNALLMARSVPDPEHPGCMSPHPGKRDKYGNLVYASAGIYRATLIAWIAANNALPPTGTTLMMHKCHNPSCVEASHLTPGDDTSNARDRVIAGRNGDTRRKDQP